MALPALHSWTAGDPLRLVAPGLPKGTPSSKPWPALGLLRTDRDAVLRRWVDGRRVSQVTTAVLACLCRRLAAERVRNLVLIWDNASCHISRAVRTWSRAHNQRAKQHGGVRLLPCCLPITSPW